MQILLQALLAGLQVGGAQGYQQLTIFPLVAAREAGEDFLLLDEALAAGLLQVTEIDEGGTVPLLRVVNRARQKVLLLDGEELVGAKQNRVLNTTILLAPESETAIPVSCVEAGRWHYQGREFRSSGRALNVQLRQRKAAAVQQNLRRSGRFMADQGEIWDEIAAKMARLQADSPTLAFSALYDSTQPTLEDYRRHFQAVPEQVGLAAFLGGKLAGVELLNKHRKFPQFFPKLLDSYILDALEIREAPAAEPPTVAQVEEFLRLGADARVERHPSVALGEDWRLEGKGMLGAALVLDREILHLSLFPYQGETRGRTKQTPLQRASRRQRHLAR